MVAKTAKGPQSRITALIREVEDTAKRLRNEIRKRAEATKLPRELEKVAAQLRKRAANLAGYVEKYAHQVRCDLEGAAKASARPAARRPASKKKNVK